ncbi:hypothetical protein [Sedimentitalea sp.]|uniref:hypothetical protein n=1 Tax=Sedimentitalea sp. TaxID=2048915 RepID=UPI00329765E0
MQSPLISRQAIWPSYDTKLAGMDALIALRADHPQVTAVACNGDVVALGACLGLQKAGLVSGRDLSVIGFGDFGRTGDT